LLDQALILTTEDDQRAEIQQLRARAKMWEGEWAYASELLATEARAIARSDPPRATFMLVDAAVAASAVGELGSRVGGIPEVAADVVHGATLVFRGETARGAPLILRHTALADGPDAPPVLLMLLPHVLICLEEYDHARRLLDRLVGVARSVGAPALLAPVLPLRAELAYRTGDWFAGYADAVEGVQLARETNQNVAAALVHLAQIEAARGLERECRSQADEALELASSHGIQGLVFLTHALVGKLELGLGRVNQAVRELELAARIVERHGSRAPNLAQEAPDLIEAYCRAGRWAEAAKALETLQMQAEVTRCSWALAATARCRGLRATAETFEKEFDAALAWHKRTSTPFERARTDLCFGERLRRAHRTSDARAHLRSALQTFERLDASSWAKRARSELAAAGETVRAASQDGLSELTPQELQLSLIVGRGATNKEAAAALFISPKTVEAHLHRIYVKLGIRSRTELAGLLARAHMLGD
jgi:ATP/maltotriose-dependent transcriptional regulator MalT